MDIDAATKRLRLVEDGERAKFYVDEKLVFEDKVRNTPIGGLWCDVASCGLDYLDGGKTLEGFLDHFEYTKDGDEEQGRKSFDYCKRVYEGFEAAGVDLWEVWNIVHP